VLRPGERQIIGGSEWQALASPGHDPHSIILWNAEDRTLISADALWEHGFGAIFPEVEGKSGFAEQRAILELISQLKPRLVIPGHGAPFNEVDQSLERAFARLNALEASHERNARSVIKTLLKFHLMIVRSVALEELIQRCAGWYYARIINERYFELPFGDFITRNVTELVASGTLLLQNGRVVNQD
jgi:glyoxylase-like metal-dependent hydrolase (beta-lactamase superfamily II)